MVDAESTPLPCGPPAIQFKLSITIFATHSPLENLSINVLLSAASYLFGSDAAGAFHCFPAVGANAGAIVDKVPAFDATRLIVFAQSNFRLCQIKVCAHGKLMFRKSPFFHANIAFWAPLVF
jgi:hypothetical protein